MVATLANVREIVLHINDLIITSYSYSLGGSGVFDANQYDNVTDKWTIPVSTVPTSGEAVLTVNYRGFMRDDMAGFYRSHYIENGTKVWMASTQFQSASARRAFPCFDVRKMSFFKKAFF